jgi:hypothetical protein
MPTAMAIAAHAPERKFGTFITAGSSKTMLPAPPLPMMAVRMAALFARRGQT